MKINENMNIFTIRKKILLASKLIGVALIVSYICLLYTSFFNIFWKKYHSCIGSNVQLGRGVFEKFRYAELLCLIQETVIIRR